MESINERRKIWMLYKGARVANAWRCKGINPTSLPMPNFPIKVSAALATSTWNSCAVFDGSWVSCDLTAEKTIFQTKEEKAQSLFFRKKSTGPQIRWIWKGEFREECYFANGNDNFKYWLKGNNFCIPKTDGSALCLLCSPSPVIYKFLCILSTLWITHLKGI